jgi:FlaA1/EpsC-like NDP-sugar epimerase
MRAYEHELPWMVLKKHLAGLDDACKDFDYEQVLASLALLVQEYSPARHGDADLLWRTILKPGKCNVVVH